jgi:hypothetical protein
MYGLDTPKRESERSFLLYQLCVTTYILIFKNFLTEKWKGNCSKLLVNHIDHEKNLTNSYLAEACYVKYGEEIYLFWFLTNDTFLQLLLKLIYLFVPKSQVMTRKNILKVFRLKEQTSCS